MKKIFLHGLTGLFLSWTIASITYSQSSTSVVKANSAIPEKSISLSNSEINPASVILNELNTIGINTKALRNFNRTYKVADAKWFESSNGLFVASFTLDKVQTFIYYNKNGGYEFGIRYYKEEKLPGEIRHPIKSKYYDFSIYQVTEVSRNNKIAYVIKMEDKTSWKTVKVVDGEMEVTEEYLKS